jgi:hypothetical protein
MLFVVEEYWHESSEDGLSAYELGLIFFDS